MGGDEMGYARDQAARPGHAGCEVTAASPPILTPAATAPRDSAGAAFSGPPPAGRVMLSGGVTVQSSAGPGWRPAALPRSRGTSVAAGWVLPPGRRPPAPPGPGPPPAPGRRPPRSARVSSPRGVGGPGGGAGQPPRRAAWPPPGAPTAAAPARGGGSRAG